MQLYFKARLRIIIHPIRYNNHPIHQKLPFYFRLFKVSIPFNTPPFPTAIIVLKQFYRNINDTRSAAKPQVHGWGGVRGRKNNRRTLAGQYKQYHADRIVYFVKWKGYSHSQNTWEPRENLANAPAKLKEWRERKLRLNLEFEREDSGEDYRHNGKRKSESKLSCERRQRVRVKEDNTENKIEKSELQMFDRKLRSRAKVWEKAQYQAQQNEDQMQPLFICKPTPKAQVQNERKQQERPAFIQNDVELMPVHGNSFPSVETSQKLICNPLNENIQSFESDLDQQEEAKIDEQNEMVEEKQEQIENESFLTNEEMKSIQEGERICIEIESEQFQQPSNRCQLQLEDFNKHQQPIPRQQSLHQSSNYIKQEQRNSISPPKSFNSLSEAIEAQDQLQIDEFNQNINFPFTQQNSTENQLQISIFPSENISFILPLIKSIISCFKCPQSNKLYLKTKLANGELILIDYITLYDQYPSILLRFLERSLQMYDRNN